MFVIHQSRRPDAIDTTTGERLDDVLIFHVTDLEEREILLAALQRCENEGEDSPRRERAERAPDLAVVLTLVVSTAIAYHTARKGVDSVGGTESRTGRRSAPRAAAADG